MTINITIIGLGQVGASIGLALAQEKTDIHRIGHDISPEIAKAAQRLGVIDEAKYNLPASVSDSVIIILCLPLDQVRPTLEIIAQDIQEGALVLDVSPSRQALNAWVKDVLPAGRYYAGLTVALNSSYVHDFEIGVDAAHADLFRDATFLLDTALHIPEQIVDVVSSLTRMLGAQPMFADSAEADGMTASIHLLPQLTAAALLNSTLQQPGWKETRKLASKPYALATSAITETDALRDAVLSNHDNALRVLDALITSLTNLREAIADKDSEWLGKHFRSAREGRLQWWEGRFRGSWRDPNEKAMEMPSFGAQLRQTFMGSRRKVK